MTDGPLIGGDTTPLAETSATGVFWRWVAFLVLSESTLFVLLGAAASVAAHSVLFFVVLVGAVALPIFLVDGWRASLRRAHGLRLFSSDGRLRTLLGGPLLRCMGSLLVAVVLALTFFLSVAGGGRPAAMVFAAPPVVGAIFATADWALRNEVQNPHRRALALRAAIFVAPVLLVAADFIFLGLSGNVQHYATLAEAVRSNLPEHPAKSALVDELIRLAGYLSAIEAFALGSVAQWGGASRVAALIGVTALNFAFYAGAVRASAVFLLPRTELRRAFLPASDAAVPRRLFAAEIGMYSAFATILLAFILMPSLAAVEDWLRQNAPPSHYVRTAVEEIDGRYFRRGTIKILQKQSAATIHALGTGRATLVNAANAGFDAMAGNVDRYLDVYYSLPAEYLRIARLVLDATSLEQRLADDIQESLMAGEPFGAYETQLKQALQVSERVHAIYDAGVAQVLASAALDLPADTRVDVVARATRSGLVPPTPKTLMMTSGSRVATGAAAGALVAALVVKKAAAKGTLKLAAKAFAKVAVSKTGGMGAAAAGGAVIGGGGGSVVPGLGTTVGAVVGAVAGVVIGVGTDYAMLKLEEAYSRDAFKQQLLAAIEEQRAVFLADLSF